MYAFRSSGIDLFVVTASLERVVEVFAGAYGYNVPEANVIGMRLSEAADTLMPQYAPNYPITYRSGKVSTSLCFVSSSGCWCSIGWCNQQIHCSKLWRTRTYLRCRGQWHRLWDANQLHENWTQNGGQQSERRSNWYSVPTGSGWIQPRCSFCYPAGKKREHWTVDTFTRHHSVWKQEWDLVALISFVWRQ